MFVLHNIFSLNPFFFSLSKVEGGEVQTLAIDPERLFQVPESEEMSYICQKEIPAEGKIGIPLVSTCSKLRPFFSNPIHTGCSLEDNAVEITEFRLCFRYENLALKMLNAGNCYFVVGSGMCSPLLITPPLRLIALLTLEALFRLRTHHQPCLSLLPFLHFRESGKGKTALQYWPQCQ